MKIENLFQRTNAKNLKDQAAVDKAKDAPAKPKDSAGGGSGTLKIDTVTISEQARNLQRSQIETTAPPARADKVQSAKAKVDSGELVSSQMVDKTAEAILSSGALGDIVNARRLSAGVGQSGVDRLSDNGSANLDEVKQRIQSGYYNSPGVVDSIAESMINDILA